MTTRPKATKKRTFVLWFLVIVVVLVLVSLGRTALLVDDWGRDLTTNVATLMPAQADRDLRPLTMPGSVDEGVALIEQWAASMSAWDLVGVERQSVPGDGTAEASIQLTRTTGLMRYVDDIEVSLRPEAGATLLTATSRSRVGKGDLGQNPRNLKELVRGLRGHQ